MTQHSSDMVERVALALFSVDRDHRGFKRLDKAGRELWRRDAAAALEASHHAELVEALDLARNRLRAAAINEAPKQSREYYDYSQWADEADAALAKIGGAA